MAHERTPDTSQPVSTSRPAPLLMDLLFYLGAFLLLLAMPSVFGSYFLSNADQARLVLVLGIVASALGMLFFGMSFVLLYRHPHWPWPWLPVTNTGMTPREYAFVLAWFCFVSAAAFGALAVLISIQGLSSLNGIAFAIGALIVLAFISAPMWIVSLRARRRRQAAR